MQTEETKTFEPSGRRSFPRDALLRALAPAAYAAIILAGVLRESAEHPWALGFMAAFTLYMGYRVYTVVVKRPESVSRRGLGGVDGVELGLLTVLVLATLHQLLPMLDPLWVATHGLLTVGLAFAVPLPELLVLPLCAALIAGGAKGGAFTQELFLFLGYLEVIALIAGGGAALDRRKIYRLKKALERLKLEAEHLEARPEGGAEGIKKGDLTKLNETLYAYLQEVKENTGAHSAVLAVKSAKGKLYVRELVSDSHNLKEEAGLDLKGSAFTWITTNKEPLRIPRISDPAGALGYYQGRVAARSFVGAPILSDGEVEGVLALDSLRDDAFSDDKLGILKVAVHQVATLLAQIRQIERVKREARDFKALHDFAKQVSSCSNVVELMNLFLHVLSDRLQPEFTAVAVLLNEGEAKVEAVGDQKWKPLDGKVFPSAEGLVGWALDSGQYLYYERAEAASRRPVFAENIKLPDFGSLLIHPFGSREEPLGALVVGWNAGLALDNGALAFCDILCQQVALGLLQIRALEKLKEMATTDELTGLKNRRIFFEVAHEAAKRSKRYHQPLSILLIDLDFFKRINDTYGHAGGDEVLRRVAELMEGHARETDLPARIGGEEFAMLMPHTDERGAATLAERLRMAAAGLRVKWEDLPVKITVSIGITQLDGNQTVEQMLEHADQALYFAKQNGRNRVERFSLMPRDGDLPLGTPQMKFGPDEGEEEEEFEEEEEEFSGPVP